MYFLRKEENVMQTLKSAIHIDAYEKAPGRAHAIEAEELAYL